MHLFEDCLNNISMQKNGYLVQVSSEGSVPANDGKNNSRYVSCSKPSLRHHKAPPGGGAI